MHIIIPYQVITGNYNGRWTRIFFWFIIPYQVITGNYNHPETHKMFWVIIPYQVITGNYNRSCSNVFIGTDYTIPSDNRELQLKLLNGIKGAYYTIPSDNRELQQKKRVIFSFQIIPYQVITGNYNFPLVV